MTVRLSTGLRNMIAQGFGFGGALNGGRIEIYTGTQPASADSVTTGTLLGIVSQSSLAVTKETRATATLTVTGGSGTLTSVTVGTFNITPDLSFAPVVWATDTTVTAALIAQAINRNGYAEATSSAAVVTVKLRPGAGVCTLALAATGITCTGSSFSGGAAAVNGLYLGSPAAGVIAKPASAVWSFAGLIAGTAGWFRFYGSDTGDSGSAISAAPYYPRLDGSVASSGADLNLSNIAIASGSPNTIDTFTFTVPAQ